LELAVSWIFKKICRGWEEGDWIEVIVTVWHDFGPSLSVAGAFNEWRGLSFLEPRVLRRV